MNESPLLPPGFPTMSIAEAHTLMTTTPGSPFEVEEREIRGVQDQDLEERAADARRRVRGERAVRRRAPIW